ncbi:MAG: dynamin family protein [Synergistaceae bacterium]|nr:dynamin family protein [Synergistaceae bacterium]
MLKLSDWERENFTASSNPGITVNFPSREIYFSHEALSLLRFDASTCPKTLDQLNELCHPEDHAEISRLEQAIKSKESFITITRRLFCGDGYYRNFRLEAVIHRGFRGKPEKLTGREISALNAWLMNASEGDKIECKDENGNVKILEAVRVQGIITLFDAGMIDDMQSENMRLRREIQRRIFSANSYPFKLPDYSENDDIMRSKLEDCINSALNVLTGNNQLKALRRSLNETSLTVGIVGLTSSGKSSFMNSLLGEKLIPEQTKATTNIPIICREGEMRSAKVFYQDGRVDVIPSRRLTENYVKDIASEGFNPGNRSGIARVEMIIPGAMIPEGICFVDTPGSDALASSGGAMLRNILPELDMLIYVTPVRARFKASDYDLLKNIMNINGKIVFVLSQIDLERDDTEAGKVIHSAHDKILGDINAIRNDMKKFCGSDFDVIPVSAKTAREKFYDKKSQAWIDANLEDVVKYFEPLSRNSFTRALILRAERTLKILEGVINRREVTGSSRWRIQDVISNLKKLLAAGKNIPEIPSGYSFSESVITPKTQTQNILSSLITSMREREFRTKFFSLDALNGKRKIILLGAERNQSLKLFSRLAHNLALEYLPDGEISRYEWLFSGQVSPFECINLPVIGDENILIAPSNLNITQKLDWHKLFQDYVPVVSIDLARVDSGLSDLAYSPYITGLAISQWVLAFGNAGLFDTRQNDLTSQVPKRVKEFIELNGLVNPEWFIFENYKTF